MGLDSQMFEDDQDIEAVCTIYVPFGEFATFLLMKHSFLSGKTF